MYRKIKNLRGMNKTANYDPVEPASQDNMYRAFSLPATTERGRNRERLEASLAGICELELLKRRQECLVLGALSLGDNVPDHPAWGNLQPARCARETTNGAPDEFVLGHQSTSLQCSLWGAMSSLEQQVGELRMGTELHPTEPPTDLEDSRPSSGFYDQCEGQSPVGQSDSSGFVELSPCSTRAIRMAYASSRPKSTGDMFISNREGPTDQACRPQIPRSLSAPYPSLEGIAEDTGEAEEGEEAQAWPWTPRDVLGGMEELGEEDQPTEEDYRQAQRVETYILGLIQRRVLPPRPCKPRTSLGHDARAISLARQSSLCRREDQHQPPFAQSSGQALSELLAPSSGSEGSSPWAFRGQDPNSYPGLSVGDEALLHYHRLQESQHQQGHYPRPRQPSLAKTPRSLSLDYPPCGALSSQYQDPSSSEPDSPQHFHSYPSPPAPPPPLPPPPGSPPSSDEQLVNAQYIPAQPCRAPARASAHTSQPHSHSHRGNSGLKGARGTYSPDRGPPHPQLHPHQQQQQPTPPQPQQHSRPRAALKKCRFIEERGSPRKAGKRACRSQSENSLLGQRVPERKYSTVERDGGGAGGGGGGGGGSSNGGGGGGGSRGSQPRGKKGQQGSGSCRRWRSTQELSQDEAEHPTPAPPAQGEQGSRRSRKSRPAGLAYAYPHPHHHQGHPHHVEYQLERERAPLGRPDHCYPHAGPGESESSLSEADSPASSSLSSDSDESGGLVWPQQLPPQLAPPSPPTPAGAPPQPKAFVKIKASHALKKKILRFRTGSLKVMTTV